MRRMTLSLLALLAATAMEAQTLLSPRAQLMLSEQTVTRAVDNGNTYVTAYITAKDGTTATVHVSLQELAQRAQSGEAAYIAICGEPQQMLDLAKNETHHAEVLSGRQLSQAYTGKGIVVGVVDAGFDYCHAAFRNTEGRLRIKRVWEQGTASFEGCQPPARYGYGIEMTEESQMFNAKADNSVNSHGTHVTAIAAGSDSFMDSQWLGTAPDADIVLVSIDQSACTHADITNAIEYIFAYAKEVGKPCVVNLSLGDHDGPHDGTSPFDTMADAMQGPGRIIVGAAGNHNADAFHISHSFASADADALKTFIKYKEKPSAQNVGGRVQIWTEGEVEVEIAAYSLFNNKAVVSHTVSLAEGVQTLTFGSYAGGSYEVSSEKNPYNGKTHILLSSKITSLRTNYALSVTVKPKTAGRVDIWADNTRLALSNEGKEGFSAPDGSSTIAEIGGTGKRIVTVGAYVTRNDYVLSGKTQTLNETVGAIGSFSSCGPTADGRTKPDVAAPGCFIISALSEYDASGQKIVAYTNAGTDRNYEYGYMQGTSMAAPFVAGMVATWLQANPQLTPEEIKEILAATVRKDSFTGDIPSEGSNVWGRGKVDSYAGLVRCIEASSVGCIAADEDLMPDVSLSGESLMLSFLSAADEVEVEIISPDAQIVQHNVLTGVASGERRSIPLTTAVKGVFIMKIKAGNKTKSIKLVR